MDKPSRKSPFMSFGGKNAFKSYSLLSKSPKETQTILLKSEMNTSHSSVMFYPHVLAGPNTVHLPKFWKSKTIDISDSSDFKLDSLLIQLFR